MTTLIKNQHCNDYTDKNINIIMTALIKTAI
jgi:hypothetical protein